VRWAFFCCSLLPLSLLPLSPMSVFSVHEFGGRRTVDPKSLPRSHTLVDQIFGRRSRPFLICPLMIADFNFHHTTKKLVQDSEWPNVHSDPYTRLRRRW
jgi:hypothetical protein